MERNLDRRVEVLCRVRDRGLADMIRGTVLEMYLRDTERAYLLRNDRYEPAVADGGAPVNAQEALMAWYATPRTPDAGHRAETSMAPSREGPGFRGLSHLTPSGEARMVDVSPKKETSREAVARVVLKMRAATLQAIQAGQLAKGDVLGVARTAGKPASCMCATGDAT